VPDAERWLEQAYENSSHEQRVGQALRLLQLRECDLAWRWLSRESEVGTPSVGTVLALMHFDKGCGHYSPAKAVAALKVAAKGGASDAAAELGEVHVYGKGVPANPQRAIDYFKQAEALGMPKSQLADRLYWMARVYLRGRQAKLNLDLGHFYHEWAQSLDPTLERNVFVWDQLGDMYLGAEGVPQDADKGYFYLRQAYEAPVDARHRAGAASKLASSYMAPPPGIAPNYAEARAWLLKCAGRESWCRWKLGELLVNEKANAQGVSRDLPEAYMWLLLINMGTINPNDVWYAEKALPTLRSVEAQLSPAEIEAAKQRAEAWIKTNAAQSAADPTASP
jgi:TPR repeat protein